jgi:2,3-dihydroxy-p-cumate/2,3-dihydroxybenzoate 3,4-dioxygenase
MAATMENRMIRYRKLGYVELNVTDLRTSTEFYQSIVGLQYVSTGRFGQVFLRCDNERHSVVLHQASIPGLKAVGWMLADESQFEELHVRLEEAGVSFRELRGEELTSRYVGRATRMVEPLSGVTFEFYIRTDDKDYEFEARLAKIQRIGHAVIKTVHYAHVTRFMREVLNFVESDAIEDAITFFRCFPNPYHHGFGVGNATTNGWHHINFMVTEIDDIGRALARLQNAGVPIVFGPGRHPASGSVFLYWLDPDGMTVEYSFGMEEFPESGPRPARRLPRNAESLDSWGSRRDPRMASLGSLERAPD